MEFEWEGFKLDTSKYYMDTVGQVVRLHQRTTAAGEHVTVRQYRAPNLQPEGTIIAALSYISTLVEVELGNKIEKVFKPRHGQVVMVRNNEDPEDCWFLRIYSHFEDGKHYAFFEGSKDVVGLWDHIKPIPEELL